ncbi:cytochrome P450 [Pluteus cervinus]|uniref:Cytochrome P450 n=1 Tax=Pluteus cervinus TaxID=181527 RepID=A0ACD3AAD0_9AGAR|nr:cytochrome P450 [Pluteus cervinus]
MFVLFKSCWRDGVSKMMDTLSILLIILALLPPFTLLADKIMETWRTNHPDIPSIGFAGRLASYLTAVRFLVYAPERIKTGYYQFPNSLFKIPTIVKWELLANGTQLANDIRRAREDQLSFHHASCDILQLKYTVKSGIQEEPYHLKVMYQRMSGGFGKFCPALLDEIRHALGDIIPTREDEWTSIPAFSSMVQVIARATNRVFIGLPVCRDPAYLSLATNFGTWVVGSSFLINLFPTILQPIVGHIISPYRRNRRLVEKILGPMLEERLRLHAEHEGDDDWEGKPNDLITWMIEEAKGDQLTVGNLGVRALFLNFASVHTSSMVTTHALFDLCVHPEYIEPLREEITSIVEAEGWTKGAMAKLYKMDSFLKESIRVSGVSGVSLMRKVVHPDGFKFSNGVTVPYGSFLGVPSYAIHHDPENYEDPDTFDGWRFYKLCSSKEAGQKDDLDTLRLKHASTTASLEYLPFGIGRRACPGRFFAIHEIKTILAQILMFYDFKLEESIGKPGERPPNTWIGYACLPNMNAKLLFRKRSGRSTLNLDTLE